jgi:hypothetical protein
MLQPMNCPKKAGGCSKFLAVLGRFRREFLSAAAPQHSDKSVFSKRIWSCSHQRSAIKTRNMKSDRVQKQGKR